MSKLYRETYEIFPTPKEKIMEKKDFIEAGYKEFPVGILERDWASSFFQKRVVDKFGIRYFIDVFFPKPIGNEKMISSGISFNLTAKIQFEISEGTFDGKLFHFKNIKEMEDLFAELWLTTGASYYE